jgi:ABC-type bacteriocin/lantibiotic exporter with double-glycine peptidase domain
LLPLSYFVFGAIVAVVWFGVRLSISGEMSVGQLISFVLILLCRSFFGGIAELYAQIQKRLELLSVFFELLRKLQKNQLREKNTPLEK